MGNLGFWIILSLQAISIFLLVSFLLSSYTPFSLILGLILGGTTAGIEYGIYTKK